MPARPQAPPAPTGVMGAALKTGLALYCVALSILFVLFGGVALMFTLGYGFIWIAPLVFVLYGVCNVFLLMLAFSARGRRMVRVSAVASIIASVAVVASYSYGGLTETAVA